MSNKKKITKRNLTQYLTDRNDSVILNKEEAPKRKRGRPKGSKSSLFSSADKKKQQAAKRTLKDKRSTIEKLEKKLRSKKESLRQQEETVRKFENSSDEQTVSKQGKVVTEKEVGSLPDSV